MQHTAREMLFPQYWLSLTESVLHARGLVYFMNEVAWYPKSCCCDEQQAGQAGGRQLRDLCALEVVLCYLVFCIPVGWD